MTNAGMTFSRETADAAQEGVSGLIYTAARLTINHEILRNLLLKVTFGCQRADFFQGGYQLGGTAGLGLVWVMSRSVRVSFTYDQTDVQPSHGQPGAASPGYNRGLGLVTFRFGLVMRTRTLLGLDFACLDVARAAALIASRRADAPFAYVVTPNADHLVRIDGDERLGEVYRVAALRLLDSRVVARLARLFGLAAPPVVTGSDLTAHLLTHHLRPGERIAIVGLSPRLPAGAGRPAEPRAAGAFRPADGIRSRSRRVRCRRRVRARQPGTLRLPRRRFAAAGTPGRRHRRGGGRDRNRPVHRRQPGFPCRPPPPRAALDQPHGLGMAVPPASEPRRLARRYLIDSPRVISLAVRQRFRRGRAPRS